MKIFLSFALIFILMSAAFISCRQKEKGDPPTLPPAETMQIDFSNFIVTYGASLSSLDVKGIDDSNWRTAAGIVFPWQEFTDLIPVRVYKAAVGYNAFLLSGSKWEWRYDVYAGAEYEVRLTGETSKTQVKWEMYVSSGSFPEFKWLEGTSNINGNSGSWTLYESHDSPTTLLQIDWTKAGANIEKIKYTYLKSGTNKDSYIEYGSASGDYNFYYTVHYYNESLDKFSDTNIEWRKPSNAGRIYLDGAWRCWNDQRNNILCN